MSVRLLVATATDVGRVRPGNEDAFLVTDDVRLIAVADGMGGHQAGEVASATAISALLDCVNRGDAIGDAITAANEAVLTRAAEDQALRGMGTTMTAGVVADGALRIGHVGDSRAYLLRDGALRQLTTDHSVIAELIAAGELTEAEALVDPRRAMITRALGIDGAIAVDVFSVELAPGDRLLLCSDGLTTMIRDDVIAGLLAGEADRDSAAEALVAAANAAGGADNITVVVADVVVADVVTDGPDDGAEVAAAGPSGTPAMPTASAPAAPPDPGPDPDPVAVPFADRGPVADPDEEPPPDTDAPGTETAADVDAHAEAASPSRRWWQRRPRA